MTKEMKRSLSIAGIGILITLASTIIFAATGINFMKSIALIGFMIVAVGMWMMIKKATTNVK
jgi:hypothetical protein